MFNLPRENAANETYITGKSLFTERTAKTRSKPSTPVLAILSSERIQGNVLDYGGGKGRDFLYLKEKFGPNAFFWDPNFIWTGSEILKQKNKYAFEEKFDTVFCTYVLNVLLQEQREGVVRHIKSIMAPEGKAYITVRADKHSTIGKPYLDGVLTQQATFQKAFTVREILDTIPGSKQVFREARYITVEIGAE